VIALAVISVKFRSREPRCSNEPRSVRPGSTLKAETGLQRRHLYLLCHDRDQITRGVFIAQLYETLTHEFRVEAVTVGELTAGVRERPGPSDLVLSVLKQRIWRRLTPFLAHYIADSGIFLYDQDPWEAYHDTASSPGVYRHLAAMIPVRSYLVTSGWWAEYIAERDRLPVKFVRMGILPRLCDFGKPYAARPYEVGFQGTVHGHRKAFFDRMRTRGLQVACLERQPFEKFLETVQDIGVFLYDDSDAINLDGIPTSVHGLWGKCLTVAARGCFVVRNYDLSMAHFGIDELPTVFAFRTEEDVPEIIEKIRSMPEKERNQRIHTAVSRIKDRNDWMTVVRALQECQE